uniref:Uncharacterized protein n=1 Tax=Acrobeloides nanus TaxID=290746 RepID=A0A914CBR5_9BILA
MSSRAKSIFGDELEFKKETCAKRMEKSIQRYTELINELLTTRDNQYFPEVLLTSSQLQNSHQSTLEQARESKHSGQASARRLYAQKSTSRIQDDALTDVTPVISEDPFHPTNFTKVPRIETRATNDNDEVFDDEDWENQQQPTTSRRIHFPPFKPSVNRRLDYHFSSDPGFQKKLYNPVERPRHAHSMDGPRYHHYHDEDWWIHAKLHELPHVLKQLRKENRAEQESLELEQQQYKMTTRKPLSARNFSEDLPEIRFEQKSPFFLASKSKPSHSIPANRQELLAFIKNYCPLLSEVAKNVLNRKNIKNLVDEFFRALEQHADLLAKRILRLKKEQRRAVGRSWSEITKQIDSDERERDLCRRKANEIHTAILRDDPLYNPARTPTKTNMGNELNQLRLLQTVFDH